MKRLIFVALMLVAVACRAGEDAEASDKGLRLKLSIAQPDGKDQAYHAITLEIENTGDDAVTISDSTSHRGDLRAALKEQFSFLISPDKRTFYGQTCATESPKSALTETLEPKQSLSITWDLHNIRLTQRELYYEEELHFPSDGKFQIRAVIELSTSRGNIKLTSNAADLIVGGKDEAPKTCIAKVISADAKAQTVVINAGKAQKIAVGDVFWRMPTMDSPGWNMVVKELREIESVCEIVHATGSKPATDTVPEKDAEVVLGVPEKQ